MKEREGDKKKTREGREKKEPEREERMENVRLKGAGEATRQRRQGKGDEGKASREAGEARPRQSSQWCPRLAFLDFLAATLWGESFLPLDTLAN